MEGYILGLTIKAEISKFVSCSVSLNLTLNWGTNILFEKLTRNNGLNLKNTLCTLCLVSHFNIFGGYLHFDALIIGLSQICLIIDQTMAEGTL